MAGNKVTVSEAPKKAEEGRQRSSISFPYVDLGAALDLAAALHDHVGHGNCDENQLAAWTDQSAKSSGFREQLRVARMSGLIEEGDGKLGLSALGREAADPDKARQAKVRAFLNVPLFNAVFEKYKSSILPPAAALERDMVSLGVAEKQKSKARQVLERSAERAGFFEHGKNRLVMPGIATGGAPPKGEERKGGGGGGNNVGGPDDPLIAAVIQKLPRSGPWTADDRVSWLKLLTMAFQATYGQDEEIEINKKEVGERL